MGMKNKIMQNIKKFLPYGVIFLFTLYYLSKILFPNLIYMGEEKGFVNFDFANFHYGSFWTGTVNFGQINTTFFWTYTLGTFWKIGQSLGLSPTAVEWWFYFFFIGGTATFTYLLLRYFSRNSFLSLLLVLIFITTYEYYSILTTSPKLIQFFLLPLSVFLWLKYNESGKVIYPLINSLSLIILLSIGVNPPQMVGAYSFTFLFILIFSLKRKNLHRALIFLSPYIINILFVFLVNILYIKYYGQLVSYNIFQEHFVATGSKVQDILRLFGGWWDYAGANGLMYNDAVYYYHSTLGIIFTYIPFLLFITLLIFTKKVGANIKTKLLLFFIVMLFLAKGSSFPFNFIFDAIYKINIFKMFREPWAKFMPDFILITLMVIAYLSRYLSKKTSTLVIVLIAIFFLFQLYPLASDQLVKTRDVDWKMLDVKVPGYWYDLNNWSKKYARDKRILVLPFFLSSDSPFKYDWQPYPFYGNAPELFIYSNIIRDRNDPEDNYIAKNVFTKIGPSLISQLGIDYVIYQNDLISLATTKINNVDFASILPALDAKNKLTFGRVDVYPVKKELLQPKIRTVNKIVTSPDPCKTFTQDSFPINTAVINKNQQSRLPDLSLVPYKVNRISNGQYQIDFLKKTNKDTGLLLTNTYNRGWEITGAKQHLLADCFVNLWIIPKEIVNKGSITLKFQPQMMFNNLFTIFLISQLALILLGFYHKKLPVLNLDFHLNDAWKNKVYSPVKNLFYVFRFAANLRLLWLVLFIFILIYNFSPFLPQLDIKAAIFILLWLIISRVYRLPLSINFLAILATVCLIVTFRGRSNFWDPVATDNAEVVSQWLVMFLIIDLLHLAILNFFDYQPLPLRNIPKEILNDVYQPINVIMKTSSSAITATYLSLERTDNKYIRRIVSYLTRFIETVSFYFRKTINAYKKDRTLLIKNLVLVILLFLAVKTVGYQLNHYFVWLSRTPTISVFEPRIVYRSTKVVIRGHNLGKLYSAHGEVKADLASDSKITFTIPLDWKDGNVKLWVEKSIIWDGKEAITKSGIFEIKLIPTSSQFTPQDDEYFKQLKSLDKETLKLNGY